MTYREIIYLIWDELNITSDDIKWETNHFVHILNKYRSFVLKQRYASIKKDVGLANYQRLPLTFIRVNTNISKSTQPIPTIVNLNGIELESSFSSLILESGEMSISPLTITVDPEEQSFNLNIDVTNNNTFNTDRLRFNFIPIDRFEYTNINKWLKNMIYTTIDYDNYSYFKSGNSNIIDYLTGHQILFNVVLEDPTEIVNFMTNPPEDVIDIVFPLEEAILSDVIDLVTKEIVALMPIPSDIRNNASDDMTPSTT